MKKIVKFLILVLFLSGCAIHFQNEKGIKASAKDIQTQHGSLEAAKGNYWSRLDIWIPWKYEE